MRNFLKRTGNIATTPNSILDKDKPLSFAQNAQNTSQANRSVASTNYEPANTQASVNKNLAVAKNIPISNITGSRGFVPQKNNVENDNSTSKNASGTKPAYIPISDVTGNRGLVSQGKKTGSNNSVTQSTPSKKDPYIPISVVTGSRDITTVSPELRAYLLKGSPRATTAIPEEYADLANVLEKAGDVINFDEWGDMTAKQQLAAAQKAGLSLEEQRELLNTKPHYVETIAKVQDLFANRYTLGITVADARNAAKELFDIADERNEAITKTGKYENDVVFAPRALRWLDEEEKKLLDNLTKNASETDWDTEYTGGNPDLAARAARRATYTDIDQAAASEQIEELIMKNVEEAKRIAALYDIDKSGPFPKSGLYAWFYQNVKKDSPTDYKNQIIWQKSLPGLPYPEEDKVYNVFGVKISSSDLGNLNYAMIGKALGLDESLLLQQAGAAALRDHGNSDFIGSQIESMKEKDRDYGDQGDDQDMIKYGFEAYNSFD